MEKFDIIVIGAGHAGVEAAMAGAKLGMRTAVFTLSCDIIANLPCNPSIGGSAKGQIVCEIDALGGVMGKAADETALSFRTLGTSKGAAARALRVQSDRTAYHLYMKSALENQDGVYIIQDEVTNVTKQQDGSFKAETLLREKYRAKAVIIAVGTYLNSVIHVGETSYESAADGVRPANFLSKNLINNFGLPLRRFKTGTPARVHARSINFDVLDVQRGDEYCEKYQFDNTTLPNNKVECYITYTNEKTHDIIRSNLHRSPLYAGRIEGTGPRYCPSIEDKIVRFADKTRHQMFIEPCGENTKEYYLQGTSSSLPLEVQREFLQTIYGLENAEIIRPAHAIEYDCVDPLVLKASFEIKNCAGLFGAGQFNGTSGYEEAAAQGLMAGINAVRYIKGEEPVILPRSSSYIGTLADDLSLKGTNEPYRMMTARSEYRLLLRSDNAAERLAEIGRNTGLLDEPKFRYFLKQKECIDGEIERLKTTKFSSNSETSNTENAGVKLYDLMKRPENTYESLREHCYMPLDRQEGYKVETAIKYAPYIELAKKQAEKLEAMENVKIPDSIDYSKIKNLRIEASQKLAQIRPLTLGAASRISGVNPADVTVLLLGVRGFGS